MGFRVSPGVSIKEIDLTTIVPAVATTPGGYAGYFYWGPCNKIITIASETELVNIFGKPDSTNYVDFFTPANFLQYGNSMQLVRVVGASAANATAAISGSTGALDINNEDEYDAPSAAVTSAAAAKTVFAARYPGALGNSLKVVVVSGAGITTYGGATLANPVSFGDTGLTFNVANNTRQYHFAVGDEIRFADGTGVQVASVSRNLIGNTSGFFGVTAVNNEFQGVTSEASGYIQVTFQNPIPSAQIAGATFQVKSVYTNYVNTVATTTNYAATVGGSGDMVSVLVFDADGKWTGTKNTLIEKFEAVSRAYDARNTDGSGNYYKDVIRQKSQYIYALQANFSDNTQYASTKTDFPLLNNISGARLVNDNIVSLTLGNGASATPTDSERWQYGWSQFADPTAIDVSLLPLGNASANLAKLVVNGVCEQRLDCMAFASPASSDVVSALPYQALSNIKTFRESTFNINSSYAVLDSGWKYQLDTYNNVVRTMPLNGDIAGLVARTEFTDEAWFSPAGFNRGQIKNVVKLAYNPTSEAHRNELYTRQVNPVVSFPGEGVILYGDKTAQSKPSAFDRINVRRLFIVLEKAIATASKFFLFEQNDSFTRAQFKNLIVPFLKTVQQRRGITDFKVVCDDTNNTGEVIDRNEFVADIFIKPTRSINFIQLNFIATKTGVNFSEVGG
jgi:hypothetical protein